MKRDFARSEAVRRIINKDVARLCSSERGRRVAAALLVFLESDVSGLDAQGVDDVGQLLAAYTQGFPGSVLETLRKHLGLASDS